MARIMVQVLEHEPAKPDQRARTTIRVPTQDAERVAHWLEQYETISSIEVRRSLGAVIVRHRLCLDELLLVLRMAGCDLDRIPSPVAAVP